MWVLDLCLEPLGARARGKGGGWGVGSLSTVTENSSRRPLVDPKALVIFQVLLQGGETLL